MVILAQVESDSRIHDERNWLDQNGSKWNRTALSYYTQDYPILFIAISSLIFFVVGFGFSASKLKKGGVLGQDNFIGMNYTYHLPRPSPQPDTLTTTASMTIATTIMTFIAKIATTLQISCYAMTVFVDRQRRQSNDNSLRILWQSNHKTIIRNLQTVNHTQSEWPTL